MEFLLSDSFVKREIFFLFGSFAYIIFYIFYEIFNIFNKIKKIFKKSTIIFDNEEIRHSIEEKLENIDINKNSKELIKKSEVQEGIPWDKKVDDKKVIKDQTYNIKTEVSKELSKLEKDEVWEIVRIVQTKINRWEYSEAKAKIIEWLSIDKFNKSLNILLASLYEKDKDYKKAEFIYKDLIVLNDHDVEIYLKLGYILSLQNKFEVSFEIYKKIHSLDPSNIEAIEMLANISHHLEKFEESKDYSKLILKKNPRNADILYLQAINLVNLEERKGALEMFLKVKQLEPYNVKVNELIEKIKIEIELESNFKK